MTERSTFAKRDPTRGDPPQERDTAEAMHQATRALTRCMVERGFALGVPHPTRGM